MRIVVVSAHFPPNFVSGGTLQPQRIARGLRDRGHDVSVYAGWLGDARAPLETWDDIDETGLSVRWIVTTPWTGWGDDNNWDNPAVASDFKSYIAAIRPDVVHLHSLQSLGAGLIREAAGTGARVVVTMHDFWWVCARQFLVDRDLRPCCLVVDAGVCECEAGRPWLDERSSQLREMLADVDLVLAPSASAARVLEANGVDRERLAVDENGLPSSPIPRAVPAGGATELAPGSLRLLYVGGSDELKGVRHLFASVRPL
ncbi:MAG: glycosyltransferase, partial [Actinomycetota bacterium]|nr:glycosyltransferase [Actinomycetota bacterium]